jgi:hypothetical protein
VKVGPGIQLASKDYDKQSLDYLKRIDYTRRAWKLYAYTGSITKEMEPFTDYSCCGGNSRQNTGTTFEMDVR